MNQTKLLLELTLDSETAIGLIKSLLAEADLRAVRTFDLQSACASFTEKNCPHHGNGPCNCQLVVLQVYGQYPVPVPLVIHGCDQQSEVYTLDSPDQPSQPDFDKQIRQILTDKAHLARLSIGNYAYQ
ncbi:MAG TPA: hypothetical protein VFZ76_03730 [Anaerolineales bacterium]